MRFEHNGGYYAIIVTTLEGLFLFFSLSYLDIPLDGVDRLLLALHKGRDMFGL